MIKQRSIVVNNNYSEIVNLIILKWNISYGGNIREIFNWKPTWYGNMSDIHTVADRDVISDQQAGHWYWWSVRFLAYQLNAYRVDMP